MLIHDYGLFAGNGMCLVITDSMGKYVSLSDAEVKSYRGDTIKSLADRIRFGEVNVSGYARILIHVGTNDISNMISSGKIKTMTIHDLLDRYNALRYTIRRRNSQAVLLWSAVLPRVNRFKLFRPYIEGINFALEKFCSKTDGACIYIPSYSSFMVKKNSLILRDKVNDALFSNSDGLHLSGAGVDVLEALFQQALSTGYLLDRVRSSRVKMLKLLV